MKIEINYIHEKNRSAHCGLNSQREKYYNIKIKEFGDNKAVVFGEFENLRNFLCGGQYTNGRESTLFIKEQNPNINFNYNDLTVTYTPA